MDKIVLSGIQEKELAPGYWAKTIHSENMTIVYWRIAAQRPLPAHSHPHEQIVNVMEGEFELNVQGRVLRLTPGSVVVIPSNVEHSGQSLTDCRIIDVFHPRREDLG